MRCIVYLARRFSGGEQHPRNCYLCLAGLSMTWSQISHSSTQGIGTNIKTFQMSPSPQPEHLLTNDVREKEATPVVFFKPETPNAVMCFAQLFKRKKKTKKKNKKENESQSLAFHTLPVIHLKTCKLWLHCTLLHWSYCQRASVNVTVKHQCKESGDRNRCLDCEELTPKV